jgi:hypothetical protein
MSARPPSSQRACARRSWAGACHPGAGRRVRQFKPSRQCPIRFSFKVGTGRTTKSPPMRGWDGTNRLTVLAGRSLHEHSRKPSAAATRRWRGVIRANGSRPTISSRRSMGGFTDDWDTQDLKEADTPAFATVPRQFADLPHRPCECPNRDERGTCRNAGQALDWRMALGPGAAETHCVHQSSLTQASDWTHLLR